MPRAITRGSTPSARGFCACALSGFSRPITSGFGTTTCRSNRPGRNKAGSKTSGWLGRQSKSPPRWPQTHPFQQASDYSLLALVIPLPRPAPRWPDPIDFINENYTRSVFLPCSNISRTRLAPTPTNISTKSDPEMVKNGTLASPAIARAVTSCPYPAGQQAKHLLVFFRQAAGICQDLLKIQQLLQVQFSPHQFRDIFKCDLPLVFS